MRHALKLFTHLIVYPFVLGLTMGLGLVTAYILAEIAAFHLLL